MSQFTDTRKETLQSVWVAGTDPALCEMMRPETTQWECWYMRKPAIYDDDGELIQAEIAAVSACYATGPLNWAYPTEACCTCYAVHKRELPVHQPQLHRLLFV